MEIARWDVSSVNPLLSPLPLNKLPSHSLSLSMKSPSNVLEIKKALGGGGGGGLIEDLL